MAATPKSTGASRHQAIYQGSIAVNCRQCPMEHRMLISSDDRHSVEALLDTLVCHMRDMGLHPVAMLTESFHAGTDLQARNWDTITRMHDTQVSASDDPAF